MNSTYSSGLQFSAKGYLPPGIHDCLLDDLRPLVFTNQHRRFLWYRLVAFLAWPVTVQRFSHIYIAGGFLSVRPYPEDVDVTLQTAHAYGSDSFATVERFFMVGLPKIREIYSVDLHFWMDGAPSAVADYRSFFQYERPKKQPPLLKSAIHGIARLSTANLEKEGELRRHLSPLPEEDPSS